LLCGDTENVSGHPCKYEPRAVLRGIPGAQRTTLYRYEGGHNLTLYGARPFDRWVGVLLRPGAPDDARAYRRCGHGKGHRYELDAATCALNLLRAQQVGGWLRASLIPGLGADTWAEIIRRADGRCYYCRKSVDPALMHREHAVPLARGGRNDPMNIVASCGPCNLRKGIATAEEFIARHRYRPPYPPPK